jgi:hypothetical protein
MTGMGANSGYRPTVASPQYSPQYNYMGGSSP